MKKILLILILGLAKLANAAEASAAELASIAKPRITPLIEAVIENDLNKARDLLKSGADINAQGSDGQTALHWAINQMTKEATEGLENISPMVKLLLSIPLINVNIADENGLTPLMLAIQNNNTPLVGKLLNPENKFNPADPNLGRTFKGKRHFVNFATNIFRQGLINSNLPKISLDVVNFVGFTPLMVAIRNKNKNSEIIKMLIDEGADVNAKYAELISLEGPKFSEIYPLDNLLRVNVPYHISKMIEEAREKKKRQEEIAKLRETKKDLFGPESQNIRIEREINIPNQLFVNDLSTFNELLKAKFNRRFGL